MDWGAIYWKNKRDKFTVCGIMNSNSNCDVLKRSVVLKSD